jgi:hypothetical protein
MLLHLVSLVARQELHADGRQDFESGEKGGGQCPESVSTDET